MKLTTILAVLFSCLVLFISVGYTDSSLIQGKRPTSYQNPSVKARDHLAVRREIPLKNGRRQFVAQAILNSIKQRRKH